jgi:hypothetical protein
LPVGKHFEKHLNADEIVSDKMNVSGIEFHGRTWRAAKRVPEVQLSINYPLPS